MTKRRKALFKTRMVKKIGPGTRLTLTTKGIGISTSVPKTGISYSSRGGLRVSKRRSRKGCASLAVVLLAVVGLVIMSTLMQ